MITTMPQRWRFSSFGSAAHIRNAAASCAIWLTVGDYTLSYESYVMPAPEENAGELYEYLLRQNARTNGMAFEIAAEDAVYLRGQLPLHAVDADELDRVVGSIYAYVERWFRPAMRIGFRSRFRS